MKLFKKKYENVERLYKIDMSKQNEFGTNTCMQDKFGANPSIQSLGIEKLIIFQISQDQKNILFL